MSFFDAEHREKISQLESLWGNLTGLIHLARDYGIDDIFQDNGAKILQQLIYLNFTILPGREGNDAVSRTGQQWEMKSINVDTSASGFSTNHHTNLEIIAKYRQVPWSFAIYHGEILSEIYVMNHEQLRPIFDFWENKILTTGKPDINNPKIPVSFVRNNGIKVYPINPENPIDPADIDSLSQQSCQTLF